MSIETLLEDMFKELEQEIEAKKGGLKNTEIRNDKGKLHAIGLPALVNETGSFWYKNGRLHRENGPAQILATGKEIWNLDGLLHRLDGPAKDNDFFVYGVKAKDNDDYLNLISEFKLSDVEIVDGVEQRVFLKNGLFHRDRGPAIVDDTNHYWYKNGRLHRDNLPAVLSENLILYYKDGKKHREDGPAKIVTEIKNDKKIITETYFDYDEIHREDGPAIEIYFVDDSGKKNVLSTQYFTHGKAYKPAISKDRKNVDKNKDVAKQYKNDKGQLHREDGPAIECSSINVWYLNGKLHRADGPALVSKTKKEWWVDGKRHREDGPAIENADGSGSWFVQGIEYSKDEFKKKIAMSKFDDDSEPGDYDYLDDFMADEPLMSRDEEGNCYWQKPDGTLHRLDGPAIILSDGTKSWYIDDKRYSEEDFKKKIAESEYASTKAEDDGTKVWLNEDGLYHRENGPAKELIDGSKEWWLNGKLHREDGPAVECPHGYNEWYLNGELHREDGPAMDYSNGFEKWYLNGIEYSKEEFNKKIAEINKDEDKDKPTEIDLFGNKFWRNDKGEFHREDGPARELANGRKEWWVNGKLHRIDGPAYEGSNGDKEWYLNGKKYSEADFNEKIAEMKASEILPPEVDDAKDIKNDPSSSFDSKGRLHNWKGPAYNNEFYIYGVSLDYEAFKALSYIGLNKIAWSFLKSKDPDRFLFENKHQYCFIYKNTENRYHREDGPAIIRSSGIMEWYLDGKRHRTDGPAISNEGSDGEKIEEYYLHGQKISKEEFHSKGGSMSIVNIPGDLVKKLGINPSVKYQYIKKAKAEEAIYNDKTIGENFSVNSCYFKLHDEITKAEEYFYGDINVLYNPDQTIKSASGKAVLHKDNGPAQVSIHGDAIHESWYNLGRLHRLDGPAITKSEGGKIFFEEYYVNGIRISNSAKYDKFYRISTPVDDYPIKITKEDGTINYMKDGKLHNAVGPAVICPDGSFYYHFNGVAHRQDGPAVFNAKEQMYEYLRNGDLHRIDGPAVEYVKSPQKNDYFIEGGFLSKEDYDKYMKHNKKAVSIPAERVSFNPSETKNLPAKVDPYSYQSSAPLYSGSTTTNTTKYVQEPTFVYEFTLGDKKLEIFGSAFSGIQYFQDYYEPLEENDLIINMGYTSYEVKPFIKSAPKWLQLSSSMIVPQQIMIDLKSDGTLPSSYGKEFWQSLVKSAIENNVSKILVVCDNGKAKTTVVLASLIAAMETMIDSSEFDVVDTIRFLREDYASSALDSKAKETYVMSQYVSEDDLNEAFTRLNAK